MSYCYADQKSFVFTDNGQRQFLAVRDEAMKLLKLSGAVSAGKLMIGSGDSWNMMACIDRLVELGDIVKIYQGPAWQTRVFVSGKYDLT